MTSLQFLYNQFEESEKKTMAPQLAFMLEHHYIEKTIQRPSSSPSTEKKEADAVEVVQNKKEEPKPAPPPTKARDEKPDRNQAALLFLFNQFEESEKKTMAPQLAFMLEQHYTEGTIQRPSPSSEQKAEVSPKKEESKSAPPMKTEIDNKKTAEKQPEEVPVVVAKKDAPVVENKPMAPPPATNTTRQSRPTSGRRVGGAVPASPYVPRARSATGGSRVRPNSAPLSPDRNKPQTRGSSAASQHRQPQPVGNHNKSPQQGHTFVERWMEKLYFRNPVVVTSPLTAGEQQEEAAAAASSSPTVVQKRVIHQRPGSAGASQQGRSATFNAGDFDTSSRSRGGGARSSTNVSVDVSAADLVRGQTASNPDIGASGMSDTINSQVFRLPPRPQSSSKRAASIRKEVAQNQLANEEAERQGIPTGIYHQLLHPQVQAHVGRLNNHFSMRNPSPLQANHSAATQGRK